MLVQQGSISFIPLEMAWLLVAYFHEFRYGKSYDRFILPVQRKLSFLALIKHRKELREFVSLIKLLVVTKMEILKNSHGRFTKHCMRPCLHRREAKEKRGGRTPLPPVRLKQVQFALNGKLFLVLCLELQT